MSADQFEDFTYTDNGTTITIDGYSGIGGFVDIPADIVGKPVTEIDDYAFGFADLTSVAIPSSVIHIGEYAFGYCGGLTDVTIPASVSSFGRAPFGACAALTSIVVDLGNPNFSSSGGVLFNKLSTVLVQFPGGLGGAYAIPASVTDIQEWAFDGCGLTSVTIPSSVTNVGAGPFYRCLELLAIHVDSGNPDYSSNEGILFDKLQTALIQFPGGMGGSYTIPSSVTNIQNNAFDGSVLSSVTIPAGVTSIGNYTFSSCYVLTGVTLPSSVTSIGDRAFGSCEALTSATFLGLAPTMGLEVFEFAAEGFKIFYSGSTSGFSSPTWLGYPAVDALIPEITVAIPSAPALVDGSSIVHFLSPSAGSPITKNFTIRNDGQQPLTGLALSKVGPNAANFTLGSLGVKSLAAGASTTFAVTCSPQAGAPQTASLRIASNDPDENPFEIALSAGVTTTHSDDFNDNSKNTSKWGTDITFGTGGTLAETNFRLEYTSTTATGDHGIYRPWIFNQATYDRDWELILDVGNSLSWTSGFRDTGIGIEIFPPSTTEISFFTEMNSSRWGPDPDERFHGFVSGRGEDENGFSDQEVASPGASGSIRVVYHPATKVLSTYYDSDGSANGYSWTPLATCGIAGSGGTDNADWSMSGSQVFQIAVYGFVDGSTVTSGQMTADNFSIITQASGTPNSPPQIWQVAKFGSMSAPEAALDVDADKDGLLNLLEYAFKLEPQVPGTPILTALTGTSGLPRITPIGNGPTQRLRLEYVRKKASSNPGITYTPQFSSNLQSSGTGGWSAITGPETVQSIDTEWERVVVEDTAGTGLPGRFGRVVVTAP